MVTDTPALVPGATEAGTEIPVMTRSGSGEGVRSFPGMVVGKREGFLVGTGAGVPGMVVGRRMGFLVGTGAGIPGMVVGRRMGFLVGTGAGIPGMVVGRRMGFLVGMGAGIPGMVVERRMGFLVGMGAGIPGTGVGRVTEIFPEEEGDPTMMRLLVPMLFVSSSSRTWSAQSAFTRI